MDQNQWILDVASRIADGHAIDWRALEGQADETTRAIITKLRAIDDLARLARVLAPESPDLSGHQWGTFEIRERIGHGKHGDVYRAWDQRLDRAIALKLIRVHAEAPTADDSAVIHEARLLARVRHPAVVMVHGADRIDGQVGLWMEFLDGRTLDTMVKSDGPLPVAAAIEIARTLASALEAVHAAGVLHRDLKAQNVMRTTDGRIVLMDFGVGLDTNDRTLDTEGLAGTPRYLAPEILAGQAASPHSDLYALGVLLFYLSTGTFPATQAAGTAMRQLRPDIPRRFAGIVATLLLSTPDDRFDGSAVRLCEVLRRVQARRFHVPWLPRVSTAAAAAVAIAVGLTLWQPDVPLSGVDPVRDQSRLVGQTPAVSQMAVLRPHLVGPYRFGAAIAMTQGLIVVGAPSGVPDSQSAAGLVYVFREVGTGWDVELIMSPVERPSTLFGSAVAFAGNFLAIGSPGDPEGGSVYLYEWVGQQWRLQKRLTHGVRSSRFGRLLAASSSLLVVPFEEPEDVGIAVFRHQDPTFPVDLLRQGGAPWWKHDIRYSSGPIAITNTEILAGRHGGWTRTDNSWTRAPFNLVNEQIAAASAIDQMGAIAGFPRLRSLAVLERQPAGWTAIQTLLPTPAVRPEDGFGGVIASNSMQILAGAPDGGPRLGGATYLFGRQGRKWIQQAYIEPPQDGPGRRFGAAVAIFGDRFAIGAPDGGGAVYLYERRSTVTSVGR